MPRDDLKEAGDELEEAFLDGLATYVESVHTAHELAEDGLWSEAGDGTDPGDRLAWRAPSIPRMARIHTDFWKGVFSLYREQSDRATRELRGRIRRRRNPHRRVVEVTLVEREGTWQTREGAVRIRNPGEAELEVTAPERMTLFGRDDAPWSASVRTRVQAEPRADRYLEVAVELRKPPPDDAFPLHGHLEVSVAIDGDSRALTYELRLRCERGAR